MLMIILIAGGLGFDFITEYPIKKISEDNIYNMQVYEVGENGKQEFFIYFEFENIKRPFTYQVDQISGEDGVAELGFCIKTPIYASKDKNNELYGQFNRGDAVLTDAKEPITELYFAGELIWSKDEQEAVPEYVKVMSEHLGGDRVLEVGDMVPGWEFDTINQTVSIYQSEMGESDEIIEMGIWSLEDGSKIK